MGFTIFSEIFAHVAVFFKFKKNFNPTIEVVTFRLCGWRVLDVFVIGIHPSRT